MSLSIISLISSFASSFSWSLNDKKITEDIEAIINIATTADIKNNFFLSIPSFFGDGFLAFLSSDSFSPFFLSGLLFFLSGPFFSFEGSFEVVAFSVSSISSPFVISFSSISEDSFNSSSLPISSSGSSSLLFFNGSLSFDEDSSVASEFASDD